MTNRWKRWCPSGCGKSAAHSSGRKDPVPYYCPRCEKWFSKKELNNFKKGITDKE